MALFGKSKDNSGSKEPMGMDLLNIVKNALDSESLKYQLNAGKLRIDISYRTETFDLDVLIRTYEDRSTLAFDCPLDFAIKPEYKMEVLEKINEVNIGLHYGCFTLEDDRVWYRFHVFPTGVIKQSEVLGLLHMVLKTVDDNDDNIAAVMN